MDRVAVGLKATAIRQITEDLVAGDSHHWAHNELRRIFHPMHNVGTMMGTVDTVEGLGAIIPIAHRLRPREVTGTMGQAVADSEVEGDGADLGQKLMHDFFLSHRSQS
jgi:hypothetical protein